MSCIVLHNRDTAIRCKSLPLTYYYRLIYAPFSDFFSCFNNVIYSKRIQSKNHVLYWIFMSPSIWSISQVSPWLLWHWFDNSETYKWVIFFNVFQVWFVRYFLVICCFAQLGFLGLVVQVVKNLPAMQKMWVRSLGQEDPLGRAWQPTEVFLPGEFHGQRNLVGYSPWGLTELDTT